MWQSGLVSKTLLWSPDAYKGRFAVRINPDSRLRFSPLLFIRRGLKGWLNNMVVMNDSSQILTLTELSLRTKWSNLRLVFKERDYPPD